MQAVLSVQEIGLTVHQLAESAYLAYLRARAGVGAVDLKQTEFADLPDAHLVAWAEAAKLVWDFSVREVEEPARELAGKLYQHWVHHTPHPPHPKFAALALDDQVVWEAVTRHLANLVSGSIETKNMAREQDVWQEWAAHCLKRRKGEVTDE